MVGNRTDEARQRWVSFASECDVHSVRSMILAAAKRELF